MQWNGALRYLHAYSASPPTDASTLYRREKLGELNRLRLDSGTKNGLWFGFGCWLFSPILEKPQIPQLKDSLNGFVPESSERARSYECVAAERFWRSIEGTGCGLDLGVGVANHFGAITIFQLKGSLNVSSQPS
jgi:hypothetical protein